MKLRCDTRMNNTEQTGQGEDDKQSRKSGERED